MPSLVLSGVVLVLSGALLQAAPTLPQDAGPWRSLFDGKSFSAWRGYKSDVMPAGWRIDGNAMVKDAPTGDIVTRDTFGDFELEFEWNIGRTGNSGIFYRGREDFSNVYDTAPEYQLLDDVAADDNKLASHLSGSLYDIIAGPPDKVKPAGTWNQARIVALGPHVEHWLNGAKMLEYDLGSAAWKEKFAASKFGRADRTPNFANFAKYESGYIGVQANHPGSLALRNMRIRELKAPAR
jgi:hypothetical protein